MEGALDSRHHMMSSQACAHPTATIPRRVHKRLAATSKHPKKSDRGIPQEQKGRLRKKLSMRVSHSTMANLSSQI
eukprot:2982285-Amphidinium_carterae.1